MILNFSLVISLVCNKDTDIEALVPASVSHHCLVLSCLDMYVAMEVWDWCGYANGINGYLVRPHTILFSHR